jgi:hypothetical protein
MVCTVACGGSPAAPTSVSPQVATPQLDAATSPVTTFSFTSDPQDFVGQGRSLSFTLKDSVFAPQVLQSGSYLSVAFRRTGDVGWTWTLVVRGRGGRTLAPGTYETSRFGGPTSAGLDFSGDGRGCLNATGNLVIHAIEFGADRQSLRHFRATFENHCEGISAALRAEVAILADRWR